MVFLLETEKDGLQSASGEMSYRISEIKKEDKEVPQLKIVLAINKFFTEIKKIKCELGVFQETHLTSISGGSKDYYVVYELETFKFSLNAERIEQLLATLSVSEQEVGEGK